MNKITEALAALKAFLEPAWKSVVAFVAPAVTLLGPTLVQGDLPSRKTLIGALFTCVVAAYAVWKTKNVD